jgi:hypothetical protein
VAYFRVFIETYRLRRQDFFQYGRLYSLCKYGRLPNSRECHQNLGVSWEMFLASTCLNGCREAMEEEIDSDFPSCYLQILDLSPEEARGICNR